MDYFFLARHGKYLEDSGSLTSGGENQIKVLGEKMKKILGDEQVNVYSSTKKRAIESTELLTNYLKVSKKIIYDSFLAENPFYHSGQYDKTKKFIKERISSEGLVLITHNSEIPLFLEVIGEMWKIKDIDIWGLEYGSAFYYNLKNSFWNIIPPPPWEKE